LSLFIVNELCVTKQDCALLESTNVDNQFYVIQRRDVTQ